MRIDDDSLSTVVHDLNGLLGVILLATQELEFATSVEETTELGEEIAFAANRAIALTRELTSPRTEPGELPTADLRSILAELKPSLKRLGLPRVSLKMSVSEVAIPVVGEREVIERAVFNLVKNATEAFVEDGSIEITVGPRFFDATSPRHEAGLYAEVLPPSRSGEYIVLTVRDDGSGMAAHLSRQALERSFSTKDASGSERGLGLPMVREALKRAGGGLVLSSTPGVGTRFELFFRRPARSTQLEA